MKQILVAILCALPFPVVQTFAADAPLPVFILVGQSNMTGADSAVSPTIPGSKAGDASVLFWNRSAYQGNEWENDFAFHPLRVQNSSPYGGDIIGPEFGFARQMQATAGMKRMAIVKVSFPSTSLAGEWKKAPAASGFAYAALQEEMAQAMKALRDAGQTPRVMAILVHQGISDALHDEAMAMAYGDNLRVFINNVRSEFAERETPVVLARENMSPLPKPEQMQTIRQSTVRVAESTPKMAWIDVDGLERVKGHHFTAAAQMEIGRRYAAACIALLAKAPVKPATHPSLVTVEDQPGLPRVLLIGDSISMGYTLPVRALLKGKANVHRIPANGGSTSYGLANLKSWLGDSKWDVIHFNFGIHDRAIKPTDYEQRLETIVIHLKATGAKIIWASTTPIPPDTQEGPAATEAILEKNRIAARLMAKHGIATDDLFTFISPHVAQVGNPRDVHFKPEGSALLGKQVAASIEAALNDR